MKIIVLEGDRTTGKTTTMGMVYATLIANGANQISFTPLNTPNDFEAVVNYQRNKKVAIYSQGDTLRDCYVAINNFGQKMDVLVMAYSRKKTPLIINPTLYTEIRLQKTAVNPTITRVQANAIDCQAIINNI
jgi:hypothetical protein